MKKYKKVEVFKKEYNLSEIICNKCGKSFSEKTDEHFWKQMVHNVSLSFGYGSNFDEESWSFDLCDECLLDVVRTFKFVPEGFFEDPSYIIFDSDEEHQQVFEDWKETGEWEDFKYKSYEWFVENGKIFRTDYINELIKKYHPDKPLLNVEENESWSEKMSKVLKLN